MVDQAGRERPHVIDKWEFELIAQFAKRVKGSDREELAAEIPRKWLIVKQQKPKNVRDWKLYLKGFLRHKISNWIRDRAVDTDREVSLEQPLSLGADDTLTLENVLPSPEADHDLQIDFRAIWKGLDPGLKSAWLALVQSHGSRTLAARRLGKHPNTIRAWIQKIRQVIAHKGLPSAKPKPIRTTKTAARVLRPSVEARDRDVLISARLARSLASAHLTGAQWRVLLWVLKQTSRRKKSTTPYSWYRIAHDLSLDRATTYRAGLQLVKAKWLLVKDGIGMQGPRTRPVRHIIR